MQSSFVKGIVPLILAVVATMAQGQERSLPSNSKWAEELSEIKLQNVHIQANDMRAAWQTICGKYLLQVNLYLNGDSLSGSESSKFSFDRANVTGDELLKAFIAAYPAYVCTQDKKTGVIWIHPKQIQYDHMLSQTVKVEHSAYQIPMLTGILNPLASLLPSNLNIAVWNYGIPMSETFDYCVDLPAGDSTILEILNYCSVWNITKCFCVSSDPKGKMIIEPINLYYRNPLATPRVAVIKFWEIEIGKPTNGIPSYGEMNAAMSDKNPMKRWAARCYLEATWENYIWKNLVTKSDNPEKAVWTALQLKAIAVRGTNDIQYLSHLSPEIATDIRHIKDPDLALVASLDLARENQDTSYLDSIVSQHKFTEAEIACIKPDVYRLVHESKVALDKLKAMRLDVPEFSSKALDELEDRNIFTLVPMDQK